VWLGDENAPTAGQVGVSTVNENTSFWDDVLRDQSDPEAAGTKGSQPQPAHPKPKVKACGA